MFAFDQASLPSLQTRKALIILDFQKDFLSEDGALPVSAPEGFIRRTVELAQAFRDSGAGEVIWVRSEFRTKRSVVNEQIVLSSTPTPLIRSARGRNRAPEVPPEDLATDDEEAFLSYTGEPQSVRAGTAGSEFDPRVASAIDKVRDLVLTKSEYSAFEGTQLLVRLRTRLATEIYICGALSNISVYATALDAGRHGLGVTVVEDCCGFRSEGRHAVTMQKLIQLVGSDTQFAADVISTIAPPKAEEKKKKTKSSDASRTKEAATPASSSIAVATEAQRTPTQQDGDIKLPIRGKLKPASLRKGQKAVEVEEAGPLDADSPSVLAAEPGYASPNAKATVGTSEAKTQLCSSSTKPTTPTADSEAALGESLQAPDLPENVSKSSAASLTPNPKGSDSPRASSKPRKQVETSRSTSPQSSQETDPTVQKPVEADGATNEESSTLTALAKPTVSDATKTKGTMEVKKLKTSETTPVAADDDAPVVKMDGSEQPAASEPMCEGDTHVFHNVLPPTLEDGIFEQLRDEVRWLRMAHQGGEVPRLICVQGEVDEDGNVPVYRHPADESPPLVPFTPTTLQIKAEVEKILGHPLNHVLVQFYRDGNDYISEHSDKTLDIVQDSFICNVSLGAERTMIFRTKRPDKDPSRKTTGSGAGTTETSAEQAKRQAIRASLPHNSLCRMGLKTNMRWLHAIRQDKRAVRDKTPAELAFGGGRISLTFRRIGTYMNRDSTLIWGQGATSKIKEGAKTVINGQTPEAIKMLQAFGKENHSSDFDWKQHYGEGFDVLNMSNAPRFFTSSDPVVNMMVQLMLAEYGIAYAKGSMSPPFNWRDGVSEGSDSTESSVPDLPIKFVDNDPAKSVVQGDTAVMLYLDAVRGSTKERTQAELAKKFTRFQQALDLHARWRSNLRNATKDSPKVTEGKGIKLPDVKRELAVWEGYATEANAADSQFIAGGDRVSVADFALWPVLYEMAEVRGGSEAFASYLKDAGLQALSTYFKSFLARGCVRRVLQGDTTQDGKEDSPSSQETPAKEVKITGDSKGKEKAVAASKNDSAGEDN